MSQQIQEIEKNLTNLNKKFIQDFGNFLIQNDLDGTANSFINWFNYSVLQILKNKDFYNDDYKNNMRFFYSILNSIVTEEDYIINNFVKKKFLISIKTHVYDFLKLESLVKPKTLINDKKFFKDVLNYLDNSLITLSTKKTT